MRTIVALTLFVYLAPDCHAEDWVAVHEQGLKEVEKRDFGVAAEFFRQCRPLAENDVQRAISNNDLGIALHRTGREAEARVSLEQALAYWKNAHVRSMRFAETSAALGLVDRMLGDYDAAESAFRSGLELSQVSGDSRSELLSALGDLLREQGRFSESRKLLQEAEAVPGVTARHLVDARVVMAELDRDTQNWETSTDEWKDAGDLARDNKDTAAEAACLRGLGQTWLDRGNAARAEPLLRSALAAYRNLPGGEGAQMASVLTSLGELYLAQDKTGLADEALQRALENEEKDFGPTHPQIAVVLELLADAVSRRNQMELARGYLDRAGKIMAGRFGVHSIVAASVFANWGTIEQRANQPERAAVQYEKALDALNGATGDVNVYKVIVMTQYAQVLKSSHHKREAEAILAQAQGFHSK